MLSNCLVFIGYIYERNLIEKYPGPILEKFHFFQSTCSYEMLSLEQFR